MLTADLRTRIRIFYKELMAFAKERYRFFSHDLVLEKIAADSAKLALREQEKAEKTLRKYSDSVLVSNLENAETFLNCDYEKDTLVCKLAQVSISHEKNAKSLALSDSIQQLRIQETKSQELLKKVRELRNLVEHQEYPFLNELPIGEMRLAHADEPGSPWMRPEDSLADAKILAVTYDRLSKYADQDKALEYEDNAEKQKAWILGYEIERAPPRRINSAPANLFGLARNQRR